MDLITHNKNKSRKIIAEDKQDNDIELEVAGTESTKGPLVATATEEMEPDLIDQLYTKPRHVPLRGEYASSWDSDY